MNCLYCENTGVVFVSNGQDDFDVEYCAHCPEGVKASEANVMRHLPITYFQSEGAVTIQKV